MRLSIRRSVSSFLALLPAGKKLMAEDIQQTHPLYASDRDILDSLLGFEGAPGADQLTAAARLATRYGEFPGADDIKSDLEKVVAGWGLTRDTLNLQCREIWTSG